jgi:hypothetical protein
VASLIRQEQVREGHALTREGASFLRRWNSCERMMCSRSSGLNTAPQNSTYRRGTTAIVAGTRRKCGASTSGVKPRRERGGAIGHQFELQLVVDHPLQIGEAVGAAVLLDEVDDPERLEEPELLVVEGRAVGAGRGRPLHARPEMAGRVEVLLQAPNRVWPPGGLHRCVGLLGV